MLPSYANLLALAAFGSLVVGNPLNHIEIQEVIKAVFEDVSTSQNSVTSKDRYAPDLTSPITTTLNALARTKEVCFWSGTAPFCEGACPKGWSTEKSNDCGDGKCCATGTKRYCCRTFNLDNCYWSGTAPFCQGNCEAYEELEVGRDNCGDGKCCGTGSKAKCCKPV